MTSPNDNGGWIERWSKLADEPDRQQFCFVPDGVGTYRIVSKSDTKYCWRISQESDIRPWYYAMWSRVEHPEATGSFRGGAFL